jgi:hypothetical protein
MKRTQCGILALVDTIRRQELIDEWAARLDRWGLLPVTPVLVQIIRPLGFIGTQALLFGQPFLTLFVDTQSLDELSSLLDDPDALDQIEHRLTDAGHRSA